MFKKIIAIFVKEIYNLAKALLKSFKLKLFSKCTYLVFTNHPSDPSKTF